MSNNENGSRLTLGITTVEDLLLNSKISRVQDQEEPLEISLKIPDYQRPYKWNAKNAIQLLDDIVVALHENRECYRVGTLILHKENEVCYNIVDGQQRTITFSLLLHAFNDAIDKSLKEKEKTVEELKIPFLDEQLRNVPANAINVQNNYRALLRRAEAINDDRECTKLLDYVKGNCEFIVVITEDLAEAFQFFDSQNARGKKLYPHDLLKAYHLREMNSEDDASIKHAVNMWEELNQDKLNELFNDLYKLREWMRGNKAWELTDHDIDKFKGLTKQDTYPYAQFFKTPYAYAHLLNNTGMPMVMGTQPLCPFQLDAPIVAGHSFFEYVKHYFDILADIRNNDKYEGYFINGNKIVMTLDLHHNKSGVGNTITRKLFDLAALLYVDRFCQMQPSRKDIDLFEQFVIYDFVWAYSLRAQYINLGWLSAQNYVMGISEKINSFNIYKLIAAADTPETLLSELTNRIHPLNASDIKQWSKSIQRERNLEETETVDGVTVYKDYLHYFKLHHFYNEPKNEEQPK